MKRNLPLKVYEVGEGQWYCARTSFTALRLAVEVTSEPARCILLDCGFPRALSAEELENTEFWED
jgi:hypothetical protein